MLSENSQAVELRRQKQRTKHASMQNYITYMRAYIDTLMKAVAGTLVESSIFSCFQGDLAVYVDV